MRPVRHIYRAKRVSVSGPEDAPLTEGRCLCVASRLLTRRVTATAVRPGTKPLNPRRRKGPRAVAGAVPCLRASLGRPVAGLLEEPGFFRSRGRRSPVRLSAAIECRRQAVRRLPRRSPGSGRLYRGLPIYAGVVFGDLGRDFALSTSDAAGRRAFGPDVCRRTVELTSEAPLLPLRHVPWICDVRENVLSSSRDLHAVRDRRHHISADGTRAAGSAESADLGATASP